ncbi:MAG: FtsX-like permease family protein [Nocardioidaceae bacterium]
MSRFVGGWRASLRMARRSVTRSKGRSALIAVMVGAPVLLSVTLATTVATGDVSVREDVPAQLGSAQAVATYVGGRVEQSPDAIYGPWGSTKANPTRDGRRLAELTDSEIVALTSGTATIEIGAGATPVEVLRADWAVPATDGIVEVTSGRLPSSDDEVLVTPTLAKRGLRTGTTMRTRSGDAFDVVGVGTYGSVAPDPALLGVVGSSAEIAQPGSITARYLIDQSAPVTWDDVKRLNAEGFLVLSRDVLANSPPASQEYDSLGSSGETETFAALAIIVTAVVIEIVLIAGPAFAVGVRRQRRELALVAASGGAPRDIRRIVLAQALVLGLGSCIVGAGLGVLAALGLVHLIPLWFPLTFGPFEVMWPAVFGAVTLGAVAAMLAAYTPARQAAKQQVAAVLAGRTGQVRTRNGWPLLGVVLIVAGLAGCLTLGRRSGGELAVSVSTIVLVLGAVLLTPLVIGLVGKVGSVLPLPLRLAVRDTARQRVRTAPAVAAIMAAVAGVTTLAIATSSDYKQSRETYQYTYPDDTTVISGDKGSFASIRAAAQAALPARSLVPISTAGSSPFSAMGPSRARVTLDRSGCANGCSWLGTTDQPIWGATPGGTIAVADAATLDAWGVDLDAGQRSVLDGGGMLAGSPESVSDGGTAQLRVVTREGGKKSTSSESFEAMAADLHLGEVPQGAEPMLAQAVVSPVAASRAGIPSVGSSIVLDHVGAGISVEEETALREAVTDAAPSTSYITVERGFAETFTLQFVLLAGLGGLAVLIGTLSATGLALSDARPDFATLAAVGAAPRTRRLMAGAQAVVLGLLGSVLGVSVGFAPGIAAAWPLTAESYYGGGSDGPYLSIPWLLLVLVVVVVPLVAAAASAIFARSRLPVVRRLAQ